MNILVLESSTSSAKAMLYHTGSGACEVAAQPYPAGANLNGVQDAEQLFSLTMQMGRQLAQGQTVDVVALCGTWHNLLLTGRDGEVKSPGYAWSYMGAADLASALRGDQRYAREYYNTTGCMVHAIYPYFKLLHLLGEKRVPGDFLVASQGEYNFFRLTGQWATSACYQSGNGLLNIHRKAYEEALLLDHGLSLDNTIPLVGLERIFTLQPSAARALGVLGGTPVIPCYPDGALNQVAADAFRPGVMTISIGTSGALRLASEGPRLSDPPSTWCYLSPYGWMSGAATSGACNCVDWAKERFFPDTAYSVIESRPVDPESLPIFLPFLCGERCPGWDDSRRASFSDVLPEHSLTDFYHSVLEGILFNIYQCYETLAALNGEPYEIQLSGGILKSEAWMRMSSNIFQREMTCSEHFQASLIGGAYLAMDIMGEKRPPRKSAPRVISPDPGTAAMYRARYQRYKELYHNQ